MFIDEEHLTKIIDLLYNECMSAGGDGDAMWYSRYYSIDKILPLVQKYNSTLKFPLTVEHSDTVINWYDGQEGIVITTDESVYLSCPSWVQMVLKC